MAHRWMSHGAQMNESWHAHEWVMAHGEMSDSSSNESWHTDEWVTARRWMSHDTHMNESWHTYDSSSNESWHTDEWVMARRWMRDTRYTHQRGAIESVMACTYMSVKTHTWMRDTRHTHEWVGYTHDTWHTHECVTQDTHIHERNHWTSKVMLWDSSRTTSINSCTPKNMLRPTSSVFVFWTNPKKKYMGSLRSVGSLKW